MTPSIEFFAGITEELSNVSLRRNKRTGVPSVLMTFDTLKAIEQFNCFRNSFNGALVLMDSEGEINIEPKSLKFIFGGDDGDEIQRVECSFNLEEKENFDRFMRFMNRYAEANDMGYQDKKEKEEK